MCSQVIIWDEPIILTGAPRSGTKMLRELLKLHPQVTGPQYEKERIWCYGNRDRINASLGVKDLTPEIKEYIRQHFRNASKKTAGKWIVDKSVMNTLRLEFVQAIFPNSPIIHIVRDGRDAVCSSMKRWKKPADLKYILSNRAFPLEELPYFIKRQLKWKLEKVLTGKKHVKWWGPKFDDTEQLLRDYSLMEICGIQWKRCTEATLASLERLDPSSFVQVRYEEVVLEPVETMEHILKFLGLSVGDNVRMKIRGYVNPKSIGRWRKDLSPRVLELLMPHLRDTLVKLGYQ